MKMDGLPVPYENGVDFFEGLPQRHQRPQFRMVKTSIGPMTPRVLCGDDHSGEIYEWVWVDPLTPPSSSHTVAEVRCNLVRGDIFPDDDIHALDALDSLLLSTSIPGAMKFSMMPGSSTSMVLTTSRAATTAAQTSEGVRTII
jgi:hypothetical protein